MLHPKCKGKWATGNSGRARRSQTAGLEVVKPRYSIQGKPSGMSHIHGGPPPRINLEKRLTHMDCKGVETSRLGRVREGPQREAHYKAKTQWRAISYVGTGNSRPGEKRRGAKKTAPAENHGKEDVSGLYCMRRCCGGVKGSTGDRSET